MRNYEFDFVTGERTQLSPFSYRINAASVQEFHKELKTLEEDAGITHVLGSIKYWGGPIAYPVPEPSK